MTEPSSWPPPPETPNPLAAHDDFLVACIRDWTPKQPIFRLRLVRDLRQETSQDLRSCLAVVNDFCDRHSILMPSTGFRVWLPLVLSAVCLAVFLAMRITEYLLKKSQDAAMTQAGKLAFHHERFLLNFVFAVAILVSIILTIIAILHQQKKAKVDAAEAVAKFAR